MFCTKGNTVFKNRPKSRIQHCEQSGQNVLPDKSILIGQNRQN